MEMTRREFAKGGLATFGGCGEKKEGRKGNRRARWDATPPFSFCRHWRCALWIPVLALARRALPRALDDED